MAGTASRLFGGLFLTLGILLLLAGVAAAGYGFVDQHENENDSGPFGLAEDQERSETNEALVVYGLAGAGVGLLATILGVVLVVVGGARERRHLVHLAGGEA